MSPSVIRPRAWTPDVNLFRCEFNDVPLSADRASCDFCEWLVTREGTLLGSKRSVIKEMLLFGYDDDFHLISALLCSSLCSCVGEIGVHFWKEQANSGKHQQENPTAIPSGEKTRHPADQTMH